MGHSQSSKVETNSDIDVHDLPALDHPPEHHETLNVTERNAFVTATPMKDSTLPSNEELNDIALAANKLWHLDVNRLRYGKDFEVDFQTTTVGSMDKAERPLFKFVDESVFERPTYKLFRAVLDNYEHVAGVPENNSVAEQQECSRLIDEVVKTIPMLYVHRYLVSKGKVSANVREFKSKLIDAWFGLYKRKARGDSCGFEHVFCGEIRDNEVVGLHNWVQFYIEEKAKHLDYHGYLYSGRGRVQAETADHTPNVATIKFSWFGKEKNLSTILLGTSPEFELALYTLVFFCGKEGDNVVTIGDYVVNVQSHPYFTSTGTKIGAIFPIAIKYDNSLDPADE